jgi:hypothetical protein
MVAVHRNGEDNRMGFSNSVVNLGLAFVFAGAPLSQFLPLGGALGSVTAAGPKGRGDATQTSRLRPYRDHEFEGC